MANLGIFSALERAVVTKKVPASALPVNGGDRGWWPIVRESFTGAWQQNVEVRLDSVLSATAVFRCISLISSDISKCRIRLVTMDGNGIWSEVDNPAYSPVLRKPNRYQNRIQFFTTWMESKLKTGNAVVLKQRDNRGVVVALYVLDWANVTPLVSADGQVYYQLKPDNLAGIGIEGVTVPASEIIHDRFNTLFHPLVGLSPIFACGVSAMTSLTIQNASANFFANGSRPGGILTAPGAISDETAARLKAHWDENYSGKNAGKVAVLGDGLKYEAMSTKAVDAQLVDQLKLSSEMICTAFGVPPYKIGVGSAPTYDNIEALDAQYYTQCLQIHFESIELCLDEGLGMSRPLGTEFDLDDLMRLDTKTQMEVLKNSDGIMKPDEQRKRLNLPPVPGGDSVYKQQQDYSLEALSRRDAQQDPFDASNSEPETTLQPVPGVTEEERALIQMGTVTMFKKQLSEALDVRH